MAKNQAKTKVTRITASDESESAKTTAATTQKKQKSSSIKATSRAATNKPVRSWGVLGVIGGYFKGAWAELRQVHWPTRGATWGLTGAVLLFAAFFVVFITLLDAGFKFAFEQILK